MRWTVRAAAWALTHLNSAERNCVGLHAGAQSVATNCAPATLPITQGHSFPDRAAFLERLRLALIQHVAAPQRAGIIALVQRGNGAPSFGAQGIGSATIMAQR